MTKDQPNILLIMTDSQRWDTIAALGNTCIKTPNLDRLANEGTAFTSAYSSSPLSVPARCSLMYGQNPPRTGCYTLADGMPVNGQPSVMETLAANGYRTHGVGKMHFTPDHQALRGFHSRRSQEEVVPHPDDDDYVRELHAAGFDHILDPHSPRGETMTLPHPAQMPARLHPTQWVGDNSVNFITDADEDQPWFMFTSFIHPHPPWAPPTPWHRLYRPQLMSLPNVPPNYKELQTWVNRDECRAVFRDQGVDWNLMRAIKAYYYACISFIDYQVGRMIESLQKRGQLDNTLIVFMSDHGDMLGDYLTFHLGSMHDGASRIPLIARWPGHFEAGGRCDCPVATIDVSPTLVNAGGAEAIAYDGDNLLNIAAGSVDQQHAFIQFQCAERGMYAVVSDRWKYAFSVGDDREYLFDRKNDPKETQNVADMPLTEKVQAQLKAVLINHLKNAGETTAVSGGDWHRYPDWQPPRNPIVGQHVYDHPWADLNIPGYTS